MTHGSGTKRRPRKMKGPFSPHLHHFDHFACSLGADGSSVPSLRSRLQKSLLSPSQLRQDREGDSSGILQERYSSQPPPPPPKKKKNMQEFVVLVGDFGHVFFWWRLSFHQFEFFFFGTFSTQNLELSDVKLFPVHCQFTFGFLRFPPGCFFFLPRR